MAKPAFDPSKPFEAVDEAAKPAFDPTKPFQPVDEQPQNEGVELAQDIASPSPVPLAAHLYNKYVTPPTRAAISGVEEGKGFLGSIGQGVKQGAQELGSVISGNKPNPLYEGKAQEERYLARNNMPDTKMSEAYPNLVKKGGMLDVSKSDIYGTARNVIEDPLVLGSLATEAVAASEVPGFIKDSDTAKTLAKAANQIKTTGGEISTAVSEGLSKSKTLSYLKDVTLPGALGNVGHIVGGQPGRMVGRATGLALNSDLAPAVASDVTGLVKGAGSGLLKNSRKIAPAAAMSHKYE